MPHGTVEVVISRRHLGDISATLAHLRVVDDDDELLGALLDNLLAEEGAAAALREGEGEGERERGRMDASSRRIWAHLGGSGLGA